MATWVVTGDVLEIADGDARLEASKDQICNYFVKEAPGDGHLPPRDAGAVAQLEFSPYPVELALVLEPAIDRRGTTGNPEESLRLGSRSIKKTHIHGQKS
jgi:hypothetical protein